MGCAACNDSQPDPGSVKFDDAKQTKQTKRAPVAAATDDAADDALLDAMIAANLAAALSIYPPPVTCCCNLPASRPCYWYF